MNMTLPWGWFWKHRQTGTMSSSVRLCSVMPSSSKQRSIYTNGFTSVLLASADQQRRKQTMFERGDYIYHGVFEIRGVILERFDGDRYDVFWTDGDRSIEPITDIGLVEDKDKQDV